MSDEKLQKLIYDWAFRVGRENSAVTLLEDPPLPVWLLESITIYEPFRAQAIADAKLYWSIPLPFGFGMELFFPKSFEIASFQNWHESIHEFSAEMEYCERMDGMNCSRYAVTLERLGRESGAWRLIEIFNEKEREQTQKMFRFFKDLNAKKSAGK